MQTFDDQVQEILIPLGAASDKLHNELVKLLKSTYIRGLRFGLALENDDVDGIVKRIEKTNAPED